MYERKFKLWYYTVSHAQMLLRSIGNDGDCNIDVYFGDVSYVEIPVEMNGIEILEATQEDTDYIKQKIGNINKTITVLKSEDRKYFVVSHFVEVKRNNLGMFELPFEVPNDMGGYHGC